MRRAFCAGEHRAGRAGLPMGTIREQIGVGSRFFREKIVGEKLKSSCSKRGAKKYLS